MKITISAPSGLESVVKREIYNLIGKDAVAINGRLTVDGDVKTVAKLNLNMRTAGRVYILLGEFKSPDFDSLFDGIYNLPLEEYFTEKAKISVSSTLIESKLNSQQAVASVVKKAICRRLEDKLGKKVLETGFNHKVEVIIRRDYLSLYLNASGESLHKRGYRDFKSEAPIKENVAASIINLSVWNKDKVLLDPFVGSGTIAIEAAMIAKNIAPGINRDFDFLHFEKFDVSFYSEMLNEAKSNIKSISEIKIFGYDIDESQLKTAIRHAKRAGVSDAVSFKLADMRTFTSDKSYGVIITNPPYGERLMSRGEIVKLYRDYGVMFKSLDNWSSYTITPVTDFERLFGKRADKKRKMYNGGLECTLFSVLGAKPNKNN